MYAAPPIPITIQRIPKSCTYPIIKITAANKPIQLDIRNSTDNRGCNLGKIAMPAITAPIPKDPNRNPKPVELSPRLCLAKRGNRDNRALLHNVNRPARTINTCAA